MSNYKLKNRLDFKSFILDKEKIQEHYEWVLQQDKNFIDEMDHFIIALTSELGEFKESVIEAQNKEINNFKSRTCSNCKYGVADGSMFDCTLDDTYYLFRGSLPKNFGCNKWKELK